MTAKVQRTITIDKKQDDNLRENHLNASALINDLLKEHFKEEKE